MPTFHAADGTELAYHVHGAGVPLICLPGGPMRESSYLGDLGGLAAHRRLIMLDPRGTGNSAVPADPASYRCDRQVDDVSALQAHLGLDRVDLLAHSAGANIAVQYAVRDRRRLNKLALITPSGRAVDLEPEAGMRREAVKLRQGEPWYAEGAAAFERVVAGAGAADDWIAMAPFFYGRWDAAAQAHQATEAGQINEEAARVFGADGAFDPVGTRAGLAGFGQPVLIVGGAVDLQRPPGVLAEFAALFPAAQLVIQPGAGHYPWLDDPGRFAGTVAGFLDGGR